MNSVANASAAAFPTVPSVVEPAPKTFFSELPDGGIISANVNYAIYPVNEKRGKMRAGFLVVQPTLLELHKNVKDWKAKKQAKHYINHQEIFNICLQSEPSQIKGECLAVMEPADTFLIRPTDSDYQLEAWLDWMLERARECRSNKLFRPVFREEFFEVAWDVIVVTRPKLKHNKNGGRMGSSAAADDLLAKRPDLEGRRRLCICSTSFLLFRMETKPTYSIDTPFDRADFTDLPMNVISNYGCQERYFFLRVGRCAEIGSGELWMQCESGATARAMHERISAINLRESDRRRTQGISLTSFPTISSRVLKSRAHRERAHNVRQGTQAEEGAGIQPLSNLDGGDQPGKGTAAPQSKSPGKDGRRKNTKAVMDGSIESRKGQQTANTPGTNKAQMVTATATICTSPDGSLKRELVGGVGGSLVEPKHKSSITGLLPFRLNRPSIASIASSCTSSTAAVAAPAKPACIAPQSPSSKSVGHQHRFPPSDGTSDEGVIAESRRSTGERTIGKHDHGTYFIEDYMTYDAGEKVVPVSSNRHHTLIGSSGVRGSKHSINREVSERSGSAQSFVTGIHPSPSVQSKQCSTLSNSTSAHGRTLPSFESCAGGGEDYTHMFAGTGNAALLLGGSGEAGAQGGGGGADEKRSTETLPRLEATRSYIYETAEDLCGAMRPSTLLSSLAHEPPPITTHSHTAAGILQAAASTGRAHSLGSKPLAGGKTSRRLQLQQHHKKTASYEASNNSPLAVENNSSFDSATGKLGPAEVERTSGEESSAREPSDSKQEAGERSIENNNVEEEAEGGDIEGRVTMADLEEMRKRAHSVGSKTWSKSPASRKLSAKKRAGAANFNLNQLSRGSGSGEVLDDHRRRIGSAGSGGGFHPHGYSNSERRTTNRSLASTATSTDTHDHAEIDFDAGSCASIESPLNRSRQSSIGVQLPGSMRSALEMLGSKHPFGFVATTGSAHRPYHGGNVTKEGHKLLDSASADYGLVEDEIERRRNVSSGHPHDEVANARFKEQKQRRRSTNDESTHHETSVSASRPLPPEALAEKPRGGKGALRVRGDPQRDGLAGCHKHRGVEGVPPEMRVHTPPGEEAGDYVLMDTEAHSHPPTSSAVPNPVLCPSTAASQRTITTIVESDSSTSSLSSTGSESRAYYSERHTLEKKGLQGDKRDQQQISLKEQDKTKKLVTAEVVGVCEGDDDYGFIVGAQPSDAPEQHIHLKPSMLSADAKVSSSPGKKRERKLLRAKFAVASQESLKCCERHAVKDEPTNLDYTELG